MSGWKLNLLEWEDKITQKEPWAVMAEDIAETFKKWELINKKFLDSVEDLIKLWKDDDALYFVEWFFGHYWWGKKLV